MGIRREIEKLETEQVFLRSEMQKSDGRASKCAKMGLSFKEVYPQDYQYYTSVNERYNVVEKELEKLYEQIKEEELDRPKDEHN